MPPCTSISSISPPPLEGGTVDGWLSPEITLGTTWSYYEIDSPRSATRFNRKPRWPLNDKEI